MPGSAAGDHGRTGLVEVAAVFLRLGATAFGGPAAHIAFMRDEFVRRRAWVSDQEFVDLLGATQLIPGPNSTEMAMHLGRLRSGVAGLVTAGTCFILPAFAIVLAIAWAYVRWQALPQVDAMLYGMKPVIVVIVAAALTGLGRAVFVRPVLIACGLAAALLASAGVHEVAVIFGAGAAATMAQMTSPRSMRSVALWPLLLFFAKVGSILFGSGYVLLAYLRGDLVTRYGWLTEAQLLDAITVGQITPGPVFTTATFIGYVVAGVPGAVVATAGIFLPAFLFVGATGRLVERLRRSRTAAAFLDGVNAASLGVMAVVVAALARAALVDLQTVLVSAAAALATWRLAASPTLMLAAGAAFGGLSILWSS